jgi:hypothetical protein
MEVFARFGRLPTSLEYLSFYRSSNRRTSLGSKFIPLLRNK